MYAWTGRLCAAAHSSLASSTAEAPSESGVELPAVIVPSAPPNTGLSLASFSTLESGRRFWSRSRPRNGTTRSSRKPVSYAAARLRELVLLLAGDPPLLGHDRRVLTHREAGARLGVLRDLRDDLLRSEPRQRLQ